MKICLKCGKRYNELEKCPCTEGKKDRAAYQRNYYENNKEDIKLISCTKWRNLRLRIIQRDNAMCQRCYHKFGRINTEELQVHHIKPRTKYPELTYDPKNLVTLCGTCNRQIGIKEELDFDFDGNKELELKL